MKTIRFEELPDRPPLLPTELDPADILGEDFSLVLLHFKEAKKSISPDDFDRLMKKFPEEDRERCARAYEKLRDYGFYPIQINYKGNMEFGQLLKSDVQQIMDKDIKGG